MYEYKCSIKTCEHIWTLKEGRINSGYLTCPHCKKGHGEFLRQIKEDNSVISINKIRHKENIEQVTKTVAKNNSVIKDTKEEIAAAVQNIVEETELTAKENLLVENKTVKKIEKVQDNTENAKEEDIFDIIIKKRKQEEEFTKNCTEEFDILEVTGDSVGEIEKRIKEYEEYYYIRVVDKNIQKQGRRFNGIIKYQRK